MLHICHITPGLGCGGAENMLYRLVNSLDRRAFRNTVVSLKDGGYFGPLLAQSMIAVRTIEIGPETDELTGLARLATLLRHERPDVIQTWMYLGDLIGTAGATLAGYRNIVWNVRHANLDRQTNKTHTILTAHACALAGHVFPRKIVFCSEESRELHERIGYPRRKSLVIENGVDTERFRPDSAARIRVRAELGIPSDNLAVGMVARFDPLKDHAAFIRSAAAVARQHPDVCFVLCGRDVTEGNDAIWNEIVATGFVDRFHFTGQRSDVPAIMAALDVLCSSSLSESFPNAVAEAMSCGVPCVVTNVGASARLVGDCGVVLEPRNQTALTAGLLEMLSLSPEARTQLGDWARQRVTTHFAHGSSVEKYAALYNEVAGARAAHAAGPVEVPVR